ncbi:PREDICTED: protocadherin beta-16-like, partial [Chlamydotis macqueenii]|uniref:protocadherin beta-16-like n=1 Tax=Chlamydotis macqueenii TaxID=187382 RepID=UPI000529BD7D
AYKNYYELVTVSMLDREQMAQYIVTITAADAGSPPLTTTQTFTVDISDINDNVPVFNQTSYTMYVRENNVPTVLVGAVTASDADEGRHAKVTYSLAQAHPAERPPCSCISVNSENGHVFVLRPLDYEQVRQIEILVLASDMGSPPLSSNVTVRLVVVDENDNAPLVLYPSKESSPPSSELATAPSVFVLGSQSGELRLRRPVTERDAVKQKLVVLVRDNGQPPQSATVALSALLLNDFSDVRLPQNNLVMEDEGDSLTTYLIVSLVFVSLLFLASMVAFTTFQVCKRKELKSEHMLYGTSHLQSSVADAPTAGTPTRIAKLGIQITCSLEMLIGLLLHPEKHGSCGEVGRADEPIGNRSLFFLECDCCQCIGVPQRARTEPREVQLSPGLWATLPADGPETPSA